MPRRNCLRCTNSIAVSAAHCRRCGYRYASGAELEPEYQGPASRAQDQWHAGSEPAAAGRPGLSAEAQPPALPALTPTAS